MDEEVNMSYWGNDYMPMADDLCVEAARSYVREHGRAIGHAWWRCDNRFYTDEQAFRYLVNVLDETREDFAEDGGDMSFDAGYAGRMFDSLAFGIATLMEGDWSTYDGCGWKAAFDEA